MGIEYSDSPTNRFMIAFDGTRGIMILYLMNNSSIR